MKKFALLLIIIAATAQLKAQQSGIKPADPMLFASPNNVLANQFKPADSSLLKSFPMFPKGQQLAAIPNVALKGDGLFIGPDANIDNMPIIKVTGNIDNMPVAKMNGNIDRMPVKKIESSGIVKLKPAIP